MTKEIKKDGVRISKYAAKKQKAEIEEVVAAENSNEEVVTTKAEINDDTTIEQTVQQTSNKGKQKKNGLPPIASKFPQHVVSIALLIKNNAEIRRFTAIGIINYLTQKGELTGKSKYISFKWNKFAIIEDGLMKEYSYNEPFFINALIASFSSFSASAQRTIDMFCKKEMSVNIYKAVNQEDVNRIIDMNETYQNAGTVCEE